MSQAASSFIIEQKRRLLLWHCAHWGRSHTALQGRILLQQSVLELDILVEEHLVLPWEWFDLIEPVILLGRQVGTDLNNVVHNAPEVLIEDIEEVALSLKV